MEANTIVPTVGRVVYYKSYGTPGGEYPSVDRAAIITAVENVTTVSLCVLNPEGMFFNQSVTQGENGGQWDWMPFQKDQQARLAKEEVKEEVAAPAPVEEVAEAAAPVVAQGTEAPAPGVAESA